MAILFNAHGLGHSFSTRALFQGLNFTIEENDRIGLIGPNGAGKSTLLRILSLEIEPDDGILSKKKNLRTAYIEQSADFQGSDTVEQVLLKAAYEAFPNGESWELESKFGATLSQFEFADPHQKVSALSGGWQKRLAIAREWIKEPDLLLLDEPTNHLDLEGIEALEQALKGAPFATLTITHDRFFLENTSTQIWELDRKNPKGLLAVAGGYSQYLKAKEEQIATLEQQEVRLKNTLRRETEWLQRGAKARTTKQQARIQRAGELKKDVQNLQEINRKQTLDLKFHELDKNPKKLIDAKNLTKTLPNGRVLFQNLSLQITAKSRIGIVGSNGSGKSTLIRTLLGLEDADSGDVQRADNIRVAYFDQNRDALNPSLTLLKSICPVGDVVEYGTRKIHIRSYLEKFLFPPSQAEMPVGALSGGEQSRVALAKLMLQPANLLVLDEPTNDLDLATLRMLEECLEEFSGAIFLVSHDRYFLGQCTNQILSFSPSWVTPPELQSFASLDQSLEWFRSFSPGSISSFSSPKIEAPQPSSQKRRLSYKEQTEWDGMEARISVLERELEGLAKQLEASPQDAKKLSELTAKIQKVQLDIEKHYTRWAELEAKS